MILEEWSKRINQDKKESTDVQNKIMELTAEQKGLVGTMKKLTSIVALKLIEEDVNKLEGDITKLKNDKIHDNKEIPMDIVMEVVSDYLEHLEFLILGSSDGLKRAAYFGVMFDEAPTYQDLISGTPKLAPYIKLTSELSDPEIQTVSRVGFEPTTKSLKGSCSTTELPALRVNYIKHCHA